MKTESMLTVSEAIEIQQAQINRWSVVLKPEIVSALRNEAGSQNQNGYDCGKDVWRGVEIDSWVFNYANNH